MYYRIYEQGTTAPGFTGPVNLPFSSNLPTPGDQVWKTETAGINVLNGLSAGQYFEVKIEYVDITVDEFNTKMKVFETNLTELFSESKELEKEIQENLKKINL